MADGETSVDEGFVAVDGGELYYKEAGSGPAVLLIHGAGPDSRGWSPTFERLAADHRVIAYDRRGYGRSRDVPREGGWKRHAEDAAAVLAARSSAPTGIVGWSAGGHPALSLAADHPDAVTAVVLAETGVAKPPVAPPSLLWMIAKYRLAHRVRGERAAQESILRWILRERPGETTWDRFDDERRERNLGNAAGTWADFSPRGRPDVSRSRLETVRVPVTLLVGDMGQPWFRRSAEALAEMLPDARIETLAQTNHAFTFHQPDAFADAIRAGLRRARAADG